MASWKRRRKQSTGSSESGDWDAMYGFQTPETPNFPVRRVLAWTSGRGKVLLTTVSTILVLTAGVWAVVEISDKAEERLEDPLTFDVVSPPEGFEPSTSGSPGEGVDIDHQGDWYDDLPSDASGEVDGDGHSTKYQDPKEDAGAALVVLNVPVDFPANDPDEVLDQLHGAGAKKPGGGLMNVLVRNHRAEELSILKMEVVVITREDPWGGTLAIYEGGGGDRPSIDFYFDLGEESPQIKQVIPGNEGTIYEDQAFFPHTVLIDPGGEEMLTFEPTGDCVCTFRIKFTYEGTQAPVILPPLDEPPLEYVKIADEHAVEYWFPAAGGVERYDCKVDPASCH